MPRPNKSGLDYFPLDVTLDEKIELIEAKHGIIGFAIIVKLYQNIYKNGYYMDATEERLLLFKRKVDVDISFINAVINDALHWGIFSEEMFKRYEILTSSGIQKRFAEATKRRKEVDYIKDFLLVPSIAEYYPEKVNVNIIDVNVNINSKKEGSYPQSKVKESKEKKRKEINTYVESEPESEGEPESPPAKPKPTSLPYKIIDLYHSILPELPKVREPKSVITKIQARWKENADRRNLQWWEDFFNHDVRESDYLMGRINNFSANLSWLTGPENMGKVLNGQYVNRGGAAPSKQRANLRVLQNFVNGDKKHG